MKTKLDGKQVRDWLRNFFDSENALVRRYIDIGDESKARDCISSDERIIGMMQDQGIPVNKSNIKYHRKDVMGIPGQSGRFENYKSERAKNANAQTA